MSRRFFPVLAITALILSALACNIPGNSSSPAPVVSTDSASTIPTIEQPTEPPAATSVPVSGECDNPFYPVAVGVSWTYSLAGTVSGNYTRSIIAVQEDGFTDQDVFDNGVTRTGDWKCDNGALIALQPDGGSSGATVEANNISASFQTTEMTGITLPATLNPAETWMQNFKLEGNETIGEQTIPAQNETAYSCTVGNTESVTVPAGTFDAVHVDCTTDIKITVTVSGVTVPTNVVTTSVTWYAPGVGIVKTESRINDNLSSTIELTAYSIP